MTDAADPNQPYVPQPYPLMLYKDRSDCRMVNSEAEQDQATAEGYMPFAELPEHPVDDLDVLSHAQLVEKLVAMLRQIMTTRTRNELIEAIRVNEEIAKHNREVAAAAQEHHDAAVEAAKADLKAEDGDESDDDFDILYGSSTLPPIVEVGSHAVQLGAVVNASFIESGLSADEWNDLATSAREDRLEATIERLADDEEAFKAEIPGEAVTEANETDDDASADQADTREVEHDVVSEQERIATGEHPPGSPEATGFAQNTASPAPEHQADLEEGEDTMHHHTASEDLTADIETEADIRQVQSQDPEAQAAARGDAFTESDEGADDGDAEDEVEFEGDTDQTESDEFGAAPNPDPLDHDGDGHKGGSLPDDQDPEAAEKEKLRADLDALGVKYHHRSGVAKLREQLDEATAPNKDA